MTLIEKIISFISNYFNDLAERKEEIQVVGGLNTSVLRSYQNQILREIRQVENVRTVLNVGAIQTDPDKEGGYYRDYFTDKEYYTLDKNRSDDHPNHFNVNLHDLSTVSKRFDLVIAFNTLEHVINPFTAINELKKVINIDGYLLLSTPYFYPTHKDPFGRFSDYWRFTDDGLRVLCSEFHEVWIKNANSVIKKVHDRGNYWEDPVNTTVGYCALFKKIK